MKKLIITPIFIFLFFGVTFAQVEVEPVISKDISAQVFNNTVVFTLNPLITGAQVLIFQDGKLIGEDSIYEECDPLTFIVSNPLSSKLKVEIFPFKYNGHCYVKTGVSYLANLSFEQEDLTLTGQN